jgi:hypothetical protein
MDSVHSRFNYTISNKTILVHAIDSNNKYFEWTFGDGSPNLYINPASHTYSKFGKYQISLKAANSYGCSATTTDSVILIPTEINPITADLNNKIMIFPNPIKGKANILFETSNSSIINIQLFDLQGRQIGSLFNGYQKKGKQNIDFDITSLAINSGIYNLRVTTKDGQINQLILIDK